MAIDIPDTSPRPRVINVRQYSAGADTITFNVTGCTFAGEITAYVKGTELMQELTVAREGSMITAVWEIAPDFTAESGCYDIQLRLESGDKVWLSDKLLLIVSESNSGEQTAENIKVYGDYIMPDCLTRVPERIILDVIAEQIGEGE